MLTILALIVALILAYWLIKRLVIGAGILLEWASEQEFLGVIAYFAAWVFLLPLMIIASIVAGFIHKANEKEARLEMEARAKIAQSNQLGTGKNFTADHIYEDATDYEKNRGY